MTEWTSSQLEAINARNSNILVSAAAGSGKTAVLVERVVRLVTDEMHPVDIDRLLVVTFTNAAAAEMKMRISKRLSSIISNEPNNSNAIRQLSLLSNAKICTIDSFCINLVRENFFKLDISQDFTILDNSKQLLLEQQIVEELIEEMYEENNEEFKNVVELLSTTKNDNDLISSIKRIYRYISSQPYPMIWLDSVCEFYNPEIPFVKTKAYSVILNECLEKLEYVNALIENCFNSLAFDELYDKYLELLNNDREKILSLSKLLLDGDWDGAKHYVNNISFSRMPSKRGFISLSKETISSCRAIYKDIIVKEIKPLLSADLSEIFDDNNYLYPRIKTLSTLIEEFSARLLNAKKELNSYSFSDVEHFAIQLLFTVNANFEFERTELAKEYKSNFYEILVDEYQDTNSAQDWLFKMLSNGKNRFMVGDVKQSIYRFRLAMPEIFTAKKDSYNYYDEKSSAVKQQINLDKNFRSRKGICDYTNFVFSKLMTKNVGGIDYSKSEFLNYGADYPESDLPCTQINLVETPEGEDKDEFEAKEIASMIINKVKNKEQIYENGKSRSIKFSDFAVLFRSLKNRIPVFTKVFAEFGIPFISNNRVNLFENNEVAILLSLLRVIDNPVQDVPLLATLMSVFYGYSADDIARAKLNNKKDNLYTSISKDDNFSIFFNDLNRYRSYAASMTTESLIRQIISETSYLSVISAMGNDEQRRLNVMKLVDLAKSFDNGESIGLTAFIRFIDSLISSKLEIESADSSGFGENAVSFMSVHKSKGLEYPVIILAGAQHRYNEDDLKQLILLNNELGIGLKVNNEDGLYRYNSIQYSAIKAQNLRASMSENLRVLYVAITRAKEQFITFASYDNVAAMIERLSKKLVNGRIYSSVVNNIKNDADLILLTALLHKDCDNLRSFISGSINIDDSFDFPLCVNIISHSFNSSAAQPIEMPVNDELVKQIKNKLSFVYERAEVSKFPSKRNASSLDEKEQSYRFFAKSKPQFLLGESLTGSDMGTAMHRFMQFCSYEKSKDNLEAEIERLCDEGALSVLQASSLNRKKLNSFFNSELAQRMFLSKKVYREFKVSSFIPLNELENTVYNDSVLVQGIADCVFEEDDGLVLVDYKTDKVKNEEELLKLYKKQISFYKSAVSKTLGKKVKQTLLYSFYLEKECIYK